MAGEQEGTPAREVNDAIGRGTQAATAGIEAASSATAAAVGGAADVAAEAAEAANRLSLATVQSGAEVVAAVQELIDTGRAIGAVVSG